MKETSIDLRQAGHFHLDDPRMELLVTACRIHNGGMPQSEPTLAVCLDSDRLDLPRVGITTDPLLLSTSTAKAFADGHHPYPADGQDGGGMEHLLSFGSTMTLRLPAIFTKAQHSDRGAFQLERTQ